jgi:tRNA/rRNA methyltransferase/tRNA (cytidine32/uridine32-2'-O)-methyltransferase
MAESILSRVHVVLYEPQLAVNIGATVRAMKNMGVHSLRLVRPCDYDPNLIEVVAHDTRDVVERMRHFDDLEAALGDCVRVAAFAGKRRAARWKLVDPRAAAQELLGYAGEGDVALLFGREDHGLPNEALDRAHVTVTIPTTEHSSLNLAQAVLVGLYELHTQAGDATRRLARPRKQAGPPTSEAYERTYADMRRALEGINFFRTRNPELVMRSARSLLYRAEPDGRELDCVRVVALEILRSLDRVRKEAPGEVPHAPAV